MNSRISSLDYLRGFAAFGILAYHFISWSYGHLPADSFLGRVGLYGVAVFYVLSGLTLYHVYEQKLVPTRTTIADFYLKRVFRLMPLLWVVMAAYVVVAPEFRELQMILLNYTGLFGFVSWDKAIGTGVWSIGNELVFYALFPLFIFAAKYSRLSFILLCVLFLGVALYFAYSLVSPSVILEQQWHLYVNPLNQVFLFLGGCALGRFSKYKNFTPALTAALLLAAILIFSFYPTPVASSAIVTGFNRFVFAGCCFMACLAMYKLPLVLPELPGKALKILGEVSYGLYLLHPLVYKVFDAKPFGLAPWLVVILSTITSIGLSYFVYHKFEVPFIRLGQKVSKQLLTSREIQNTSVTR
ncbi:acyltransferase family protein [Pontibacter vulgaris]|uniref:acyltransferase family protein n=1 Tax=Pontibacter vulgaris TaxID=2905679 RepID=UPI001FA6DA2C|nr:acyltransferase [Pontibacter vulgaris]